MKKTKSIFATPHLSRLEVVVLFSLRELCQADCFITFPVCCVHCMLSADRPYIVPGDYRKAKLPVSFVIQYHCCSPSEQKRCTCRLPITSLSKDSIMLHAFFRRVTVSNEVLSTGVVIKDIMVSVLNNKFCNRLPCFTTFQSDPEFYLKGFQRYCFTSHNHKLDLQDCEINFRIFSDANFTANKLTLQSETFKL